MSRYWTSPDNANSDHTMDASRLIWFWVLRLGGAVVLLTLISMAGCPAYNVYSQRMEGRAILAHAESAREVQVMQAKGEKEAAEMRAQAIKIVGEAAKNYPEYRQQEFIGAFAEALKEGKINQIMYVPTEANIPITEAGRYFPKPGVK